MILRKGLILRPLGRNFIVTGDGLSPVDFSKVISLNETAAYLWEHLEGREFLPEDLVKLLQDRYDVDAETARADVDKLLLSWQKAGLLETEA